MCSGFLGGRLSGRLPPAPYSPLFFLPPRIPLRLHLIYTSKSSIWLLGFITLSWLFWTLCAELPVTMNGLKAAINCAKDWGKKCLAGIAVRSMRSQSKPFGISAGPTFFRDDLNSFAFN
jgi:hypothetical protein